MSRVRTRTFRQAQTTECPVAALGIVLDYHGRHVSMEELRRVSGVSRDCLTAAEMLRAAHELGLQGQGRRAEVGDFQRIGFPLIAHLRFIHFVVVEGLSGDRVHLNDPACGHHDMSLEDFDERFTGIVLKLEPSPALVPGGEPVPVLRWLGQALRRQRKALEAIVATSLLLALPPIAAALLLGRLVDGAVGLGARSPAAGLAGLLAAAGLAAAALAWVRDASFARVETELARRCGPVLDQLLQRPFSFFVYRLPGDLMDVVLGQQVLGRLLGGTFVRAACDLGGTVPVGVALVAIDPRLGLWVVAVGGGLLVASRALVRSGARRYAESLGLLGLSAASFERMEMSKTGGLDGEYFSAFASHDARRQSIRQLYEESRALARQALPLAEGVAAAAVLGWGGHEWSRGNVSAGSLIAVLLLGHAYLSRIQAVLGEEGELDAIQGHVTSQAEAESSGSGAGVNPSPAPEHCPPPAVLALRDVTFGYSRNKRPVVAGVTLALGPGTQLGISGPSGGGKSTLAGLIAGLHQPWSGQVELPPARDVAWIGKVPALFEGSLRDNLSLWDPDHREGSLQAALSDACLDDVVALREGGLDAPVEARGTNFSAGQRQRIEIARALLQDPQVLVLDEALDAIEPELELHIRSRLRSRGCALVVVSQRATTLAACDQVIELEQGQVAGGRDSLAARAADPPRGSIASPTHAPQPGPAPPPEPVASGDLIAAFRSVAEAAGATLEAEGVRDAFGHDLMGLCREAGLRARRVRLPRSNWWRRDCGPLLGFLGDGGQPVALLPRRSSLSHWGYDLVDPRQGGRRVPLDAHHAAQLGRDAYVLHGPFADALHNPARMLWDTACAGGGRRDWTTFTLASLGLGAATLGTPVAAAVLLGQVAPATGAALPLRLALSLLLVAVAAALFGSVHHLAWARAHARIEHQALAATWDRLVRLPVAFLRRQRPAEFARRCDGLRSAISQLWGPALASASAAAAALLAIVGFVAWIDPALAAVATAVFAAPLPLALLVEVRAGRDEPARFRHSVAQRQLLFDLLRGMARLRSAGAERRVAAIWERTHDASLASERDQRARRRPQVAIDAAWPLVGQAALVSALATGVAQPLAAPAVAALLLAFQWGAESGLTVAALGAAALAARARLEGLEPVFQTPPEERARRPRVGRLRGAIEARELRFQYDGARVPALDGVSLTIAPGELVAITGPSGGGKSTLLRVLLGFERPESGSVAYDAHSLGEVDLGSLRAQLGAVLQEDQLTVATLRYNLAGTSPFALDAVWEATRLAAIEDEIRALPMGIQTITEDGLLSGGQKQRVLIAARLLRRPRVLFLDEATSALPDQVEREILHNIRGLGITCVYAAHRPSAVRHADRVYVIDRGRVAQVGTPEETLGRGLLARLHGTEPLTP